MRSISVLYYGLGLAYGIDEDAVACLKVDALCRAEAVYISKSNSLFCICCMVHARVFDTLVIMQALAWWWESISLRLLALILCSNCSYLINIK